MWTNTGGGRARSRLESLQFPEANTEVKLKLNPAKWRFKTQKVIFMGFQLSPEGVSPAPTMVEAISNLQTHMLFNVIWVCSISLQDFVQN